METSTSAGRGIFLQSSRCAALAAVVALLSSTAAMAASVGGDCRGSLTDLQAAMLSGLTLRIVDLGDPELEDAPQAPEDLTESMAPLLFLTPRVTSILEDVFADSATSAAVRKAQAAPNADTAPGNDPLPGSPVAGIESHGNTSDAYESLSRMNDATSLPRFQRQMYRTDI